MDSASRANGDVQIDFTEERIASIISSLHPPEQWIFATQVRTHTGDNDGTKRWTPLSSTRYIDAFAMHLWPSRKHHRVAYEIKSSREDWLKELDDPIKRVQAFMLSNEFYFVMPEDIFNVNNMPPNAQDCGVYLINPDGLIYRRVRAKKTLPYPMPDTFVASLLRNVRKNNWG